MERKPIRKFKRKIKKEKYGEKFKKQINIANFKTNNFFLDDIEKDLELLCIEGCELKKQIIILPEEIQKKLYILAMRNYWKYTTLNTIYKPMYNDYYSYIEKEKGKVYYDNIHFMHLEFNTLESTKEWIPGCQCDFCLNDNHPKYTKEYKQAIYDKMLEEYDMEEYHKCIHCYDYNYWNSNFKYNIIVNIDENFQYSYLSHKIYDPLKGVECTVYDKIKDPDSPIYFSEEVINN